MSCASATVTFTSTAGNTDTASPHVQALVGSELTDGTHNLIVLANNPTLVNNTVYSIAFKCLGTNGVSAAEVTSANVNYGSVTAGRVYGQLGIFTTAVPNNGGLSASSLSGALGVASDTNGVYIADGGNNRVLFYAGTTTSATRVYGQLGSFVSGTGNNGGLSANSLSSPFGVSSDSTGVYIADTSNHRVLYYPGTSTTATRVYGQLGSFGTNSANNGGLSADSLNGPSAVGVDATGVYIVDNANNRVLYYAGSSTTATRVYGQSGSFISNSANNGGVSANSLSGVKRMAIDTNGVYLSDNSNNRVLFYPGTSTTASRVYGQFSNFTTASGNNGGISANSISTPGGVAADSLGVYIGDGGNNRVLFYSESSTTASRVYGQFGSFTTNTNNNGGISANSLAGPSSIAIDSTGIFVLEFANNRVLFY